MTFALLSSIDERRIQVVAHRGVVKEAAAARRAALYASCKFHNFSADVDDLQGWMEDKLKTVTDESHRGLTNLERKLKKHIAFERELHANEGWLHVVNKESIRHSIIVGSTCTRETGFDNLV
jgi:spectrin alpha